MNWNHLLMRIFERINDKINEYFKSITLQDLVDKYQLSKEE